MKVHCLFGLNGDNNKKSQQSKGLMWSVSLGKVAWVKKIQNPSWKPCSKFSSVSLECNLCQQCHSRKFFFMISDSQVDTWSESTGFWTCSNWSVMAAVKERIPYSFTSFIVVATSQLFLFRKPVLNDSRITALLLFIHRRKTLPVVRRV